MKAYNKNSFCPKDELPGVYKEVLAMAIGSLGEVLPEEFDEAYRPTLLKLARELKESALTLNLTLTLTLNGMKGTMYFYTGCVQESRRKRRRCSRA